MTSPRCASRRGVRTGPADALTDRARLGAQFLFFATAVVLVFGTAVGALYFRQLDAEAALRAALEGP